MENNEYNSNSMNTANGKNTKSVANAIATISVILATVFFMFSAIYFSYNFYKSKKAEMPYTGEEMMSETILYGIDNATPFLIVEDSALFRARIGNNESGPDENLAVALAKYRENALYEYAYEAVGDEAAAEAYRKLMDSAREKMQVDVYADYIDGNYDKLREQSEN